MSCVGEMGGSKSSTTMAITSAFPTVATVLIALARTGVSWSGKSQRHYEAIVKVTGHTLGPRWPKTISKFGSELRRIAPQLRLHGISINSDRRGGDRVVTLKMEGATPGIQSTNEPKA
jgi:hypothetical protein